MVKTGYNVCDKGQAKVKLMQYVTDSKISLRIVKDNFMTFSRIFQKTALTTLFENMMNPFKILNQFMY